MSYLSSIGISKQVPVSSNYRSVSTSAIPLSGPQIGGGIFLGGTQNVVYGQPVSGHQVITSQPVVSSHQVVSSQPVYSHQVVYGHQVVYAPARCVYIYNGNIVANSQFP